MIWAATFDRLFRERRKTMRRILGPLTLAGATLAAFAPAALASTDVQVHMSFTEPAVNPGCTVTNGVCGVGTVEPYGPATETIEFGAACNGTCDLCTVYRSSGSLFIEERLLNDGTCPGPPGAPCRPSNGRVFKPFIAPLGDTVVGGTGIFEGATGRLNGTVSGGGPVGGVAFGSSTGGATRIALSGTITLAS
jgi:hypothetical protein